MNTAIQFFGSTGKEKPFPWGNALYMDNVDDLVTIPYSESLDFTGRSYTIIAWVYKPEAATTWESLISNWNGFSNAGQHLGITMGSDGLGNRTNIRTGNSTNWQFSASGTSITGYSLNSWNFRAYQSDREGVNGLSGGWNILSGLINSDPSFPTGQSFWSSGDGGEILSNYSYDGKVWSFNAQIGSFSGTRQKKYIDTIAFFDRVLTNSEILRIYGKGKGYLPTKIPGCVACYLFDESPGAAIQSSSETPGSPASRIILDHSGNGNHAYATGYGAGSVDFVDHFTLI